MVPVVKHITLYPVKSLDGVAVQKAQIGTGGSLVHDREYAIFDTNGKYVNGKKNTLVHHLDILLDFENESISVKHKSEEKWNHFHLVNNKRAIDEFLSTFFKIPVSLQKDTQGKFLDVPVNSGITVLSTASLQEVSRWFNDMPLIETRTRFRANLEIDNVPAFWEDQLFNDEENAVEFKMGDIILFGMSPRARCVVPTRHPHTGELISGFQKSFALQRLANLPSLSTLNNYGHGYYLSVDCFVPQSEFGKWIKVGDPIEIISKRILSS